MVALLNLSVLGFFKGKRTQQGYLLPSGAIGLRGRRGQLRSQYQVQEEWMRERPGSKKKKLTLKEKYGTFSQFRGKTFTWLSSLLDNTFHIRLEQFWKLYALMGMKKGLTILKLGS